MSDMRPPFDEALKGFCKFLRDQGWSDELLWLSADRVTGHKRRLRVFRLGELDDHQATQDFYEAVRCTDSSIRIDGLCKIRGRTLAYVEDYGGDSRFLNYGVHTGPPLDVRSVSSGFVMLLHKFWNLVRGLSPFLKHTKITPKTNQANKSQHPTT